MTLDPEKRELQAKQEAGETTFSPGVKAMVCTVFAVLVIAGTSWQLVHDVRMESDTWPKTLDLRRLLPVWEEIQSVAADEGPFDALRLANRRILANIDNYETELEDSSPLIETLVPSVNLFLISKLRGSTESVYPGIDDWLFYRPDVEYVTSRGFLDPNVMDARRKAEAEIEPDPFPAIIELRDALSARNIELLVVPAPVKTTIYPERYTRRYAAMERPIQNSSYITFLQRLKDAGILYVDLTEVLWDAKRDSSQLLYLPTDTHWSPAGMRASAKAIADAIRNLHLDWGQPLETFRYSRIDASNQGDILAMLRLPERFAEVKKESVAIEQVTTDDGREWSPGTDAEILFLGDSFINIYSLPSLGWGRSAGLVEHVSAQLGRRAEMICINDNGSYATRLTLAGQIRRGRDRLTGKKIVVYEFACRELAFGDWKTRIGYY